MATTTIQLCRIAGVALAVAACSAGIEETSAPDVESRSDSVNRAGDEGRGNAHHGNGNHNGNGAHPGKPGHHPGQGHHPSGSGHGHNGGAPEPMQDAGASDAAKDPDACPPDGGSASPDGGTSVSDAGAPVGAVTGYADLLASSKCGDQQVHHEVFQVRNAAGRELLTTEYTCSWSFSDGGTASACNGFHTFPGGGRHTGTVVVRETATGATGTFFGSADTYEPLVLGITAQAPSCGLSFTYETTRSGGLGGRGALSLDITPRESVVTVIDPPPPTRGTIEVSAPGTYQISAYVEQEGSTAICQASATTTVTVTACPP